MKKLTILTSVLALAACGGGSGGGAGVAPRAPIDVATSNSIITNMVSTSEAQATAYVVDTLGTEDAKSVGLNTVARTAAHRSPFVSSISKNSLDYDKAKELVEISQWLNNPDTTKNDIVSLFEQDKNKIKAALKLMKDMYCFVGGDAEETADRILAKRSEHKFDEFLEELKEKTEVLILDRVDFKMSSASNGDEAGGLDIVKFEVDKDSKIIGGKLYALNSGETLDNQDTKDDSNLIRQSDSSNIFDFTQERDEKLQDETTIHKKLIGTAKIETYGRDTGNRYSDFGRFIIDLDEYENGKKTDHQTSYEPFAGGYTDKQIIDLPSESMEFAGKAAGSLKGKGSDDKRLDGPATLTFDGTKQTIGMQFDNWYDVNIEKNINEEKLVFKFSGTSDENFALSGMENGSKTVTIDNPGNYNGKGYGYDSQTKGKLEINYYGNNGNPEEFVGVTQYVESFAPSNEKQEGFEVRMNIGFGGTRQ